MRDFPQKFGKFDLLDLLSNGGMAEVYLARTQAEDPSKRRPLAIKKLLPFVSKDREFIKMFEREIGITFHLNHPNIIKVYESGFIDQQYYIAMEHVLGRTLDGFISDREVAKGLSETVFAPYVVREICRALTYAHDYKDPVTKQPCVITHRDISPQNIFVSYAGNVKLFDFGIARCLIKEGSTAVGVIKGKPAYVSPEQVLGKPVDIRTDIFSLGVVLWEVLTGQRLFINEQVMLTLRNVVEMEIPPPSEFNPAVGPELDAITLKALQRDPELRYQSAADFGVALDGAIKARFQDFGNEHFAWLMKNFFAQEMEVAHEDLAYKLRLKANSSAEAATQSSITRPNIQTGQSENSVSNIPKSNKRNKFFNGVKREEVYRLQVLSPLDERMRFNPMFAIAAVLLMILGAYAHYSLAPLFVDETRTPASDCGRK